MFDDELVYPRLEDIVLEGLTSIEPKERLKIWETAERYRFINNPGAYVGPWDNSKAPYLVEPMNIMSSREHTGMIFVGPAQCGKTDLFLNWVVHTVMNEPADLVLVHMSRVSARDFSIRRLDRLNRDCPEVGRRMVKASSKDNTYDKMYINGSFVSLSWPSITELSSKTVPYLWLTDYDRMPQDLDGEGIPYDLAKKRTTTYKRFGMTVAESSPGFPMLKDPRQWSPSTPHEAPPAEGILSLYNRGDRRRWYWQCESCRRWFEPRFRLMIWPESNDVWESAEQASIQCPHQDCGQAYSQAPYDAPGRAYQVPGKAALNAGGRWAADGQTIDAEGRLLGPQSRSDTASFWLFGPAASFLDWTTLVANYLKAMKEFRDNGSTNSLKTTTNLDQGEPFAVTDLISNLVPEKLAEHQRPYMMGVVPEGVRFLIVSIDVQKNSFVVCVHGFDLKKNVWIIDRYVVHKSVRKDEDGERLWIRPASYFEDWLLLIDQVLTKTYPLGDNSHRRMRIKLAVCDSAGADGVSTMAYDFYRHLRSNHPDLAVRFQLLKGTPNNAAPRVTITYPDSTIKNRTAGARGEIPVMLLNSNAIKDAVNGMLSKDTDEGGYVSFPSNYAEHASFEEFTAEVRNERGRWVNPKKRRNEGFDLLAYAYAGALCPQHVGIELLSHENPPRWAAEWDFNTLVYDPAQEGAMVKSDLAAGRKESSLATLGQKLAGG